jgi:hypothetical protein
MPHLAGRAVGDGEMPVATGMQVGLVKRDAGR